MYPARLEVLTKAERSRNIEKATIKLDKQRAVNNALGELESLLKATPKLTTVHNYRVKTEMGQAIHMCPDCSGYEKPDSEKSKVAYMGSDTCIICGDKSYQTDSGYRVDVIQYMEKQKCKERERLQDDK